MGRAARAVNPSSHVRRDTLVIYFGWKDEFFCHIILTKGVKEREENQKINLKRFVRSRLVDLVVLSDIYSPTTLVSIRPYVCTYGYGVIHFKSLATALLGPCG